MAANLSDLALVLERFRPGMYLESNNEKPHEEHIIGVVLVQNVGLSGEAMGPLLGDIGQLSNATGLLPATGPPTWRFLQTTELLHLPGSSKLTMRRPSLIYFLLTHPPRNHVTG